jgi:curli biogenesis system outer membrane secretion channel CsgG
MNKKGGRPMIKKIIVFVLGIVIFYAGCAAPKSSPPVITGTELETIPPPPSPKKLVAIAGFENKSTYSADKLWDTSAQTLMAELLNLSYFRVVEWEKMKRLFDWEVLSTSSLVKNPEEMKKAQRILLCDYFLSGAVTRFDVQVHSGTSALKKKKVFETSIRIDLLLQDPNTGEYLSQGIGKAKVVKELKGGLGGSQGGMWDPASASDALERAISSALRKLVINFSKRQ